MVDSGKKANLTGQFLEDFVEQLLIRNEYNKISSNDYINKLYLGNKVYSKQAMLAKTIYESNWKMDFVISNQRKDLNLGIECKWQQSAGSVDEKYPYTVLNIKKKSPIPCIIVIDGGGYKQEAYKWLKNQIGGNLTGVFNMSEFTKFVNNNNI